MNPTPSSNLAQKQQLIKSWVGSGSINVFGRPYAGKDTQCTRLADWLGGVVIGGGDILRSRDDVDMHLREAEESGRLVEQAGFLALVTPYFKHHDFKQKPLILSSIGRWDGEQEAIVRATRDAHHATRCVIYIETPESLSRDRFHKAHIDSRRTARTDHDEETLEVRLQEFANKTIPVLDYYEFHNLLITVSGNGSVKQVETAIIDALYERASASR